MATTFEDSDQIARAVAFAETVELPSPPRVRRGAPAGKRQSFDETKEQSLVVGSDIVSFAAGFARDDREVVVNCSLLAQLAANRKVAARDNIRAWYDAYFETLANLGWSTRERGFSEHRETGDNFEVNQAVLSIASVVLGEAATAIALVETTLKAMKSMTDGPWMTIFKRESQAAKVARFQVTIGAPIQGEESMLTLMAFDLDAKSSLTQVLFLKFGATDVVLRHSSGRVTIDSGVLRAVGPAIARRVTAYTRSFVARVPI